MQLAMIRMVTIPYSHIWSWLYFFEEFTRLLGWTDQYPNDSDLLWHMFCTYMDFHLSPSPNTEFFSGEFVRAFSTVYFVKSPSTGLPIGAKENTEAFFIRMVSI